MTHFAKELRDVLLGPPAISQVHLAKTGRLPTSKVSRLLRDLICVDRRDLDAVLLGVPKNQRKRLVKAYVRDRLSPQALLHLTGQAGSDLSAMDFPRLPVKSRKALDYLLNHPNSADVEHILVDLATALGWKS